MIDEISKMEELFDNMGADKYPLKEFRYIGERGARRLDGHEKASGHAAYTMDVNLPHMLYMRFLTSPYPHAAIKSMDTSRAEALPGVAAILRYDDPELPPVADLGGHGPSALPPLPGIAYFQGEEVGAAVAAETEAIAEQALKLIKVEWEKRPFVLDVAEAIQEGAPLANPEENPKNNLMCEEAVEKLGDVEKGFQEAERIIEFRATRGFHTWAAPERPCGVFKWNGQYPEVWVKQQRPHISKRAISTWYGGIPMNQIQMHCLYQGASFGGWSQQSWNLGGAYCAGVMAKRTARPVKWVFSRREDFYGGEMDYGFYEYKVGFKNNGLITAVGVTAYLGNQRFPFGPVTHFIENTRIPHVLGKRVHVFVNKGWNVPTRCEQNLNTLNLTLVFDHVANELGMDPTELAVKNDGSDGHDMEWLNARKAEMGFPVRDSLEECLEKGKQAIGWDNKWHAPGARILPNGKLHGIGFTWTHEWDDSAGSSEMAIRIERNDGTATVFGMRADGGVDAENAYCQVAADELGLKLEDIHYRPQIDPGFFAMTPDSSTAMSVNGYCVRSAARILKQQILEAATRPSGKTQRISCPPAFEGCKPEDLDIKDSIIFVKKDPARKMTLAQFVGTAGFTGPISTTEFTGAPILNWTQPLFAHAWQVQRGAYSHTRLRLSRQAHFMEVEVDPGTGFVEVTRVVNVNDVGKAINVMACEGQQYGGTYMGVGRGLMEEIVHDPVTGVMLNGNLIDYKYTTINDCGPIDTILVESQMGYGPYGLVGIGEDVATVIPALLGPAVYNAIGVWIDDFPITPQKVLEALGKA
jgi:CO/xanthine dehydrogenase Mo-binding subunit